MRFFYHSWAILADFGINCEIHFFPVFAHFCVKKTVLKNKTKKAAKYIHIERAEYRIYAHINDFVCHNYVNKHVPEV